MVLPGTLVALAYRTQRGSDGYLLLTSDTSRSPHRRHRSVARGRILVVAHKTSLFVLNLGADIERAICKVFHQSRRITVRREGSCLRYPYAHFLDRCSPCSCGARGVTSRSTSCRNAFAERATGPRNRSASARKEAVDQHDQNAGLMWVKNPGSRAQTRRHRNSVSFRPRGQASDAPGTISPHTQGARPVVMAGFPWRHTDASMPPWGIVCSKSGSRQADMGVAGTKRR